MAMDGKSIVYTDRGTYLLQKSIVAYEKLPNGELQFLAEFEGVGVREVERITATDTRFAKKVANIRISLCAKTYAYKEGIINKLPSQKYNSAGKSANGNKIVWKYIYAEYPIGKKRVRIQSAYMAMNRNH